MNEEEDLQSRISLLIFQRLALHQAYPKDVNTQENYEIIYECAEAYEINCQGFLFEVKLMETSR